MTKPKYPQSEALELARLNAIRLLGLHVNNTPEDRAKAMGFVDDMYHGSKQDLQGGFKPGYDDNLSFVTPNPTFANQWIGKGKHTERTGDAAKAELQDVNDKYRAMKYKNMDYDSLNNLQGDEFTKEYDRRNALHKLEMQKELGGMPSPDRIHSTVYPMRVKAKKTFDPETDMHHMHDFFAKNQIPQKVIDLYKTGNYMMYETKPVVAHLKSKGFDSMKLRESSDGDYTTVALFDPAHIRSRFAAFDPAREHEAGLSYAGGGKVQPTVDQMLAELRNSVKGDAEPFDPIGQIKRDATGAWNIIKAVPSNLQRLARDPAQYVKDLPAPTGDQIMGAFGPSNIGMAGIMIGPNARTWNAVNAAKAKAMEAAGHPPEQIWRETGNYRGPDNAWRQEINDQPAKMNFKGDLKSKAREVQSQIDVLKGSVKDSLARDKQVTSDLFPKESRAARRHVAGQASDLDADLNQIHGLKSDPVYTGNHLKHAYEHPELYAAYPDLERFVLRQGADGGPKAMGSLEGPNVNIFKYGLARDPKSTLTHEMQHAIQGVEDWPRGGNPEEFMDARRLANQMIADHETNLTDLYKKMAVESDPAKQAALKQQYDDISAKRDGLIPYTKINPHSEYERLAGEAEARMVQNRLDMTPEERANTHPMTSYGKYHSGQDVDPNQLTLIQHGETIEPSYAKGGGVEPMGINVASDRKAGMQYADMIVDGKKTLESRNSDTLRPYVGKRVAIVRTGEGKAKAIGEVTIGEPMVVDKYKFRALQDKHHVPEGSAFDINTPTKHLYPMHDPVRYSEERDVGHGIVSRKLITKAKGGEVEVRRTVKDETLQRTIPEIEAAARAIQAGDISHADYDKIVNKHKPVKPYKFVPMPATDEDAERALMANKKPHWRGAERWPSGRKVGLRLDIPAYETHGVWVNSIHDEEGKGDDKYKTSYGPVSSVKNATFDAGPNKGIKVATGEDNKSPFARIKGELHHMHESAAVEHMQKYLNHPDWAQVGMDPRRHGFFYDRKTMKPITHSAHVVQIGPLVLAHKPTYGERESYADGGEVSDDDYRGSHQAPGPHFGAQMHDVLGNGMYPKDFYSSNGLRYYADASDPTDRDAYNKVSRVKGKPNEMVSIHRAIPTSVYNDALKKEAPLKHMIRKGDWVAINKEYAKLHGDSVLRGDYKIASMRVPAKHVWTNADSIHEWGYHPE